MTTANVWTPPAWAVAPPAPATPRVSTPGLQVNRVVGDPRFLTALVLIGLIFVVGFRQPLSHAIGTAGTTPPDVPPLARVASAQPVVPMPHAAEAAAPVRVHAPRDPFAPLGARTVPMTATGLVASRRVDATSYRVHPGDSLWSLAVHSLGSAGSNGSIVTTWRRIYADNRAVIGGDPSKLRAGVVLRLSARP